MDLDLDEIENLINYCDKIVDEPPVEGSNVSDSKTVTESSYQMNQNY